MRSYKSFLTALLFAASIASAEPTTLWGGDSITSHGGYFAPVVKSTHVDGHTRVLVGAEGGWIINHSFYLGLGGYGMPRGIATSEKDSLGKTLFLHMGYGGVLFGYTFRSDDLLHIGMQHLIGAGGIHFGTSRWADSDEAEERCDRCAEDDDCDFDGTGFFVWEPQLHAELNITRWMRLSAGAGYRVTWIPEEKRHYKDSDLNGPSASVALKFGRF